MKDLFDWLKRTTETIPATRPFGWTGTSRYHRPPGMGNVKLGSDSGIRKLARAMRRGCVPSERMQVIEAALTVAQKRADVYANKRRTRSRGFLVQADPAQKEAWAKVAP